MKEEQDPEYIVEDAAEVVHENLSLELQHKFSYEDIIEILETEFEFLQIENIASEPNPNIQVPIDIPVDLDEDGMKYFIINKCAQRNILLNYEELQEILDAEFIYLVQQGLIKHDSDIGKYYN